MNKTSRLTFCAVWLSTLLLPLLTPALAAPLSPKALIEEPVISPFAPTAVNCNDPNIICKSGTLSGNETWTSNYVYVLTGNLTVPSGVTLSINAGTVVKVKYESYSGYKISLVVNGTLNVSGTAGAPVYFTGERDDTVGGDTNGDGNSTLPSAGDWQSIQFLSGSGGTLGYVEIRYGGYSSGAVYLSGSSPALDHLTVRYSNSSAVSALASDSPIITNFTAYNTPYGGLWIRGGTLTTNSAWNQTGIVYILGDNLTVAGGSTLTIAPGVIVKVKYESYSGDKRSLVVNGTLNVNGTAGAPVYFTSTRDDTVGGDTNGDSNSTSPLAGDWQSIHFRSGSSGALSHLIIRYGGYPYGVVRIEDASPAFSHCAIHHNSNAGVYVYANMQSAAPTFSYCTVRNNPIGLHSQSNSPNIANPVINNSEIYNNTNYGVYNATSGNWIDAINNWWGNDSGPYDPTASCTDGDCNNAGTGDRVNNYVQYRPWTVSTTPPTAPGGLSAVSVSASQIDLSWSDNSNNENGFKIERSPNGSSDWTQIASVNANVTTYQDSGLTCGTTYYYRVYAYNTGGNSSYSNTASATTLPCSGGGDSYEPDDTCAQARTIPTDGTAQPHTFHDYADEDWVTFAAISGTTYILQTTNTGPLAHTILELYDGCAATPVMTDDLDLGPGARLVWTAPQTGNYYVRVLNHTPGHYGPQASYDLAVRAASPVGAVIVVAGRNNSRSLRQNINYAANRAVQVFLDAGLSRADVRYLNSDSNPGGGLTPDAPATSANLQFAIQTWAAGKVGPGEPLYVYLVDHGGLDVFMTDGSGDTTTAGELDGWLSALEAATGCEANIIIEACRSGSFIDTSAGGLQELSSPGRVVIASTSARLNAYALPGRGAYFSDPFFTALAGGADLWTAFEEGKAGVQVHGLWQIPWLDDDGDALPHVFDPDDGAVARRRGLSGLRLGGVAPYIVSVSGPAEIVNGRGTVRVGVMDDLGVDSVWALVYPPSFQEPAPTDGETPELVLDSFVLLDTDGDGEFVGSYSGFNETGVYRIVVYAKDADGNLALPQSVMVRTGWQVYLPLVLR